MDLCLKAWGQEDVEPFTPWEVKRNEKVITLRQEKIPRIIGITIGDKERVKIDYQKIFETLCPPEIVGKPIVCVGTVKFGFEGNGTEIFIDWLEDKANTSEDEIPYEYSGGDPILRFAQIPKDKILTGNIGDAKSLVSVISQGLKFEQKVHPWSLTISGYDFDPRPLSEIPEVANWYRRVHSELPYFPILLSPFALNPYLLSVLDAKIQFSRKETFSENEKRTIESMVKTADLLHPGDGEELRKQLEYVAYYKTDEVKVENLCSQISLTGRMYLQYLSINKSNQNHILTKAFERIRSALKSV